MVDCANLGDHMLRSWANESTAPTALGKAPREQSVKSLQRGIRGSTDTPREKDKQWLRREG